MIIQCVKCNKNFEVNSSLIPDSGRILQCGSCNHKWFYDPNNFTNYQDSTRTNLTEKISIINENEDLVKIKKKKFPFKMINLNLIKKILKITLIQFQKIKIHL